MIAAVNLAKRLAITDDGKEVPVTAMFDNNGEKTDEAADAVAVVIEIAEGKFVALDVTEYRVKYN
jgi:LDH2 family malate/lactate/ureidoglycolate dehydrogenase